ncbi:hypothetical protein [Streptomyces sp. NPDC020747]|uniref:hypothetical protein n=1 Tax=Streptomyces sp. NPDC020747 TaxID=3365086 RepID=UPI0037BE038B
MDGATFQLASKVDQGGDPRAFLVLASVETAAQYGRDLGPEDIPLIRPYLIAYEREQERRGQRDRRTAATIATLGIDVHGAAV